MRPIPKGYQQVMPYIIVKDAAKFLQFLQNVFGAVEQRKVMRTEKEIMHAEIKIGDSTIMFADATEMFNVCTAGLFVYVDDADSRYVKCLQNGAVSLSEPADQDYGRSCGIRDPFGNTWWLTSQ
jgi:PhnB protein